MSHATKSLLAILLLAGNMHAGTIQVNRLCVTRPFIVNAPLQTDSTDALGNPFDHNSSAFDNSISPKAWKQGTWQESTIIPSPTQLSVRLVGFEIENNMFAKCEISIEGTERSQIYIDGKAENQTNLLPGRHDVVIKILQQPNQEDTLKISVKSDQEKYLTINPSGKRLYTLEDYMHGTRAGKTELSSTGRFIILNTTHTRVGGQVEHKKILTDLETGKELPLANFLQWASSGDRYISTKTNSDNSVTYEYVTPGTNATETIFTDYSASSGYFLPGERLMVISKTDEGPTEDPQVHQILEPDDRIPGWRNRSNLQVLDVETGQITRLTAGQHNVWGAPSPDGSKFILMVSENCMTERPFTFTTALLLDRKTMQADTLVQRDGFISQVQFTPDGKNAVFSGSPEAFDGIGKNDPTNKIPSMIQTELYLMDLSTHQVKPLTLDFNPNISQWVFSKADGNLYALCENRDRHDMFRFNMKIQKWEKLKLSECYVNSFSLASEKPIMSYTGQSDSNSDRTYIVDLKSGKEKLFMDFNEERMGEIALGKCEDWNFKSSRGDTISGCYYLPPHFDANKKYPMLVYYYGGCSPTGRYLDSYYNFHGWAAMGYVVYVIQPSGCTGFGQEFAARHVNAYGDYTAEDIIQGTKQFCKEHPYVNEKKIGCLGASYGGFMTMYLQTVTDIFAAAMAHAGISNPTSYWGYGYWGYSYSAISAADSYPWNNAQLFSGHAPLFNADKVHTPILFLHGGSDTNVPFIESVQMFNALKILGRECALVKVEEQDHHILDYEKRLKWVHTFYAWFAKYLQDDPTWWDTMYPTKNLK